MLARQSGDASQPLTVSIEIDGPGSFGVPGVLFPAEITIEAGQPAVTLNIGTEDDQFDELDSDLVVTIVDSPNYRIGDSATATVRLLDNDTPTVAEITASPEVIAEVDGESEITLEVNTAPAVDTTFDLAFSGDAKRGEDFNVPGSITVEAGQTTGSVTLRAVDDTLDEVDETLNIGFVGQNEVDPATVTITDNDVPTVAAISASPQSIPENGGESTVTVILSQAPVSAEGFAVAVTFAGTAVLTKDYDARGGFVIANGNVVQLVFAQGVARQTFTVTGIADREKEQEETVDVSTGGQSAKIAITNVFKESVLADVRREGSFALLRRNTDRFSNVTGDVVGARLGGRRFSKVEENTGWRTSLQEFSAGLKDQQGQQRTRKSTWDAWVSVGGAKLSGKADGNAYDVYAGIDTLVAPGFLIGVLGSYEVGDLETSGVGEVAGEGAYTGQFDSRGYSVGAYAGVRVLDDLLLDLAGSYGRLSPELSATFGEGRAVTGEYEARRLLLSGHLTGQIMFGNLQLSPQVGVVYGRENQDGFTDSSNAVANAATLELARFEFGTTVAYAFDLDPEQGALGVSLTATGRSDFIRPDDIDDQYSLALRLGLEWAGNSGVSLKVEGGADGIGLDGYNAYDASATVKVPF